MHIINETIIIIKLIIPIVYLYYGAIILCKDDLETQGWIVISAGLSNREVAAKLTGMYSQRPAEITIHS